MLSKRMDCHRYCLGRTRIARPPANLSPPIAQPMNNIKINHLAVWACIIGMHVFGFLWYGPLFGDKWLALVGMDQETMQASSQGAGIWIMNSVAIIAAIYALAWVLQLIGVMSGIRGAGVAFVVVFCIHHLPVMNANMFAQDPYGLAWITGGYSLVWMTISGFILGAWVKMK